MVVAFFVSQESGNELTSLLPSKLTTWEDLVSDVFASPQVCDLERTCMSDCVHHKEFSFLSIDACKKPSFTIIGQAAPSAPPAVRAAQALDESQQRHDVVTIKGRTGGLVAAEAVRQEEAAAYRDVCRSSMTPEARESRED